MIPALIILAACIAAIALLCWLAPRIAPLGWESEEHGFQYGEPGDDQ